MNYIRDNYYLENENSVKKHLKKIRPEISDCKKVGDVVI